MEQILLSGFTLDEIKGAIAEAVEERIKSFISVPTSSHGNDILMSRNEVAKYLKISLPTLHSLTKNGSIPGHRVGRRVLYKLKEVESALQEIAVNKYKRKKLSN